MDTMKQKTAALLDAGDPDGPQPEDIEAFASATVFEVVNTLESCPNRRAFMVVRHYNYLDSVVRGLILASYQAGIEDTRAAGLNDARNEGYHAGEIVGRKAGKDKGLAEGYTDGYEAGRKSGLKELRKAEAAAWRSGYDCGFQGAVNAVIKHAESTGPND